MTVLRAARTAVFLLLIPVFLLTGCGSPANRSVPAASVPDAAGAAAEEHSKEKRVTLILCGDRPFTVSTERATAAELLADHGIVPDGDDELSCPPSAKLFDGMTVRYDSIRAVSATVDEPIPYTRSEIASGEIPVGEKRLISEGKDGVLRSEKVTVYRNGELWHSFTADQWVAAEPTDEVTAVGSGGVVTASDGEPIEYSYYIDVIATAYGGEEFSGLTRTGTQVRPGVIAVDPEVIPLGSRCFIDGLGICSAEDTGGAIKGNRIDVYFDADHETLMQFGRQHLRVYVLG